MQVLSIGRWPLTVDRWQQEGMARSVQYPLATFVTDMI